MKESYAQLGEDLVIDHYLTDPKHGYYVDIGAYDPIELSNTYKFYLRGWQGVCVEPNLAKIKRYKDIRPNDNVLNEACGTGDLKFKVSEVHPSLSSCENVDGIEIAHRPLSEYLAMLPQVTLLSIDTEGLEMNVLESSDWNVYRPTIVVIEIIQFLSQTKNQKIYEFMRSKDYGLVYDNCINAIFIEGRLFKQRFPNGL